jgi:hypothetical protein
VRGELVANTRFAALAVSPPASYEPGATDAASIVDGTEPGVANKPVVHDDTTLVRQAIERFRVTYNARLVSHNDVRPGGLLELHSCAVALAGDGAVATCTTGAPSEPADSGDQWTIGLERTDHGWSIKTIVSS